MPLGERTVEVGEPLEFLTWICAGKDAGEGAPEILRFVARAAAPLVEFDAPSLTPAGDCVRLEDSLDTTGLAAGGYSYHVRFRSEPNEEPKEAIASFEVVPVRDAETEKTPEPGR